MGVLCLGVLILAFANLFVVPHVPALRKWAIRNRLRSDLGYNIQYVVPNGFRGILVIKDAPQSGVAPDWLDNHTVRYTFPPSGTLTSSDVTPLLTWHDAHGMYHDGRRINSGEIQLRELTGFNSQKEMYLLVGTPAEADRFWGTFNVWSRIDEDYVPLDKRQSKEDR
jgi:hypothetical protein